MKLNAASAAVISAFFGMIGGLGQVYLSKPRPPSDEPVRNPHVEALPTEPKGTVQGFGAWVENLKTDVAYPAQSDGFLVVFTGGGDPAKGADLLTGDSAEKLTTRTRVGGPYDGAVLPVPQGHYWLVRPRSAGTVNVQWLPSTK